MHDPDGSVLLIKAGPASCQLSPGEVVVLGRSSSAGLQIDDPLVSRQHAMVHQVSGQWRVTDLDTPNGVWRDGVRVAHTVVDAGLVTVLLGGQEGAIVFVERVSGRTAGPLPDPLADPDPYQAPGLGRHPLPPGGVGIGRAASNGISLDDLLVSREHAHLERSGDVVEIVDLDSANGTFVNGRRVTRARLSQGDEISIGPYSFTLEGSVLVEAQRDTGLELAARDVSVTLPDGRALLHDVSFTLPPRTLTAVIGPSGAGKSTLLKALSGLRAPDGGEVLYGGYDFFEHQDLLARQIGFVPQEDILHRVLTVGQALDYGARLRFPADTSVAERAERIREVTQELSLADRTDTRIDRLSGGERKRASTALELLTKPNLLFLDEPTSGLDVDLDRSVMRQLRTLADGGRTVVLVTHNLEHLDECDVIIVLGRGGHLTYLGSPEGIFDHFGVTTWADVFDAMKQREPAEWAARMREHPERHPLAATPRVRRRARVEEPARRSPRTIGRQLDTLIRRQLAVTASDRTLLGILVLLPLALSLLSRGIPGTRGLSHQVSNTTAGQLLMVAIVGGALMGTAGSIRDLVGERAVHRRERAVGLDLTAYLGSKVITAGGIGLVQGTVLGLLSLVGRKAPASGLVLASSLVELAVAVALVTASSAMLGLVISAAVQEESQAMPLLVLATMLQLTLCGGTIPVAGTAVLEQLSWFAPARWAFAAAAATVDFGYLRPDLPRDDAWKATAQTWWTDLGLLLLLTSALVALCAWLLRRDSGRSTGPVGRRALSGSKKRAHS